MSECCETGLDLLAGRAGALGDPDSLVSACATREAWTWENNSCVRRNWARNSAGDNSHELEYEVVDNSVCCQMRINDSSRTDLGHACETERSYTWVSDIYKWY